MNQRQLIEICWRNEEIRLYCRALVGSKERFFDWEELLHELIIQLYKMDEEKLMTAARCNYLEYLCFTIIKRIWAGNISETGIFKKRIDNFELKVDFEEIIEESHNFLIDELGEEISKLHWYNATLLKMYLEGFNLREISEKTGINLKSVHYALKKTRTIIKNNLEKKYGTNLSNLR
jgi:DNA-directed RNA polymerase specialized sigma24 family protein